MPVVGSPNTRVSGRPRNETKIASPALPVDTEVLLYNHRLREVALHERLVTGAPDLLTTATHRTVSVFSVAFLVNIIWQH